MCLFCLELITVIISAGSACLVELFILNLSGRLCFKTAAPHIIFLLLIINLELGVFLWLMCLSGLVVPEKKGKESVPEVVTTSGYALLHFFSDAAYNLTGFNIAYSYVYTLSLCYLGKASGDLHGWSFCSHS